MKKGFTHLQGDQARDYLGVPLHKIAEFVQEPSSLAGVHPTHGDPNLNASLAAATALSISCLSPSDTSQIFFPVAGLITGKVLPLTESTNSLLIKIFVYTIFGSRTGFGDFSIVFYSSSK